MAAPDRISPCAINDGVTITSKKNTEIISGYGKPPTLFVKYKNVDKCIIAVHSHTSTISREHRAPFELHRTRP